MKDHKTIDDSTWVLKETAFSPAVLGKNETLFALGNGNLGLRGDFEEENPHFHRGTYINGFFEKEPIVYGERAYGFAENHETILNLPDAKLIELTVGGDPFRLDRGTILNYSRTLDLRSGVVERRVKSRTPKGIVVEVYSRRMVSFARPNVGLTEYRVTIVESPQNRPVHVLIDSKLKGTVSNLKAEEDPRVGSKFSQHPYTITRLESDDRGAALAVATKRSRLAAVVRVKNEISLPGEPFLHQSENETLVNRWSGQLAPAQSVTLYKYMAYGMAPDSEADRLWDRLQDELERGMEAGPAQLMKEQEEFLSAFWDWADVEIDGDPAIQQALRFNIFHILQSSGRDGRTSIAAKGLTGEGYEGHYFWDTEIYICPLLTYTVPELARNLLTFRYSILDRARSRAALMSEKGALFPWRTIDGEETSAYYPAGTAQYHINADIVYAMEKYCAASGDQGFLFGPALEVAIETSRLWHSLGHYGKDGKFRIDGVTGPDEYTALVNNNVYTNLMAQNNLLFTIKTLGALQKQDPARYRETTEALSLTDEEIRQWERAAQNVYVPYDGETGIYPQDDSFLQKETWPFDRTPRDQYPLLLHFHPLVIYRHRVLKQPDLVLAQFLLSEKFSLAAKIRNFRFYEGLTTGDSSLSHCIQNIMACETGETEKAYGYFTKTVRMDLDDVHGNSRDGIHTAAMAGSWMSVVYGFAGFRDRNSSSQGIRYSFNPIIPDTWKRYAFALHLGPLKLHVEIRKDEVTYRLEAVEGVSTASEMETERKGPLWFLHRNQKIQLNPGESKTLSLRPVLKAVLFDLDGVVTDTARYHYQAWKRLADDEGWDFDERINERLKGVSRMESLQIILDHNHQTLDAERKKQLADKKNRYYGELLDQISSADILPHIADLLHALGKRGIKRVLCSASRNAPAILEKLGLAPVPGPAFDAIASPDQVCMGKPDPELFLLGAQRVDVWPTDCIGIEDAQAGIDAIKAAGMRALGIGKQLVRADQTVASTAELSVELLDTILTAGSSKSGGTDRS